MNNFSIQPIIIFILIIAILFISFLFIKKRKKIFAFLSFILSIALIVIIVFNLVKSNYTVYNLKDLNNISLNKMSDISELIYSVVEKEKKDFVDITDYNDIEIATFRLSIKDDYYNIKFNLVFNEINKKHLNKESFEKLFEINSSNQLFIYNKTFTPINFYENNTITIFNLSELFVLLENNNWLNTLIIDDFDWLSFEYIGKTYVNKNSIINVDSEVYYIINNQIINKQDEIETNEYYIFEILTSEKHITLLVSS